MASNSSGTLSPSQTYTLGDYSFRLVVTKVTEESITSIQCHASDGSSNAQTGIDEAGTNIQVDSWRVEAEDKTATVYATMHKTTQSINTNPLNKPIPHASSGTVTTSRRTFTHSFPAGTMATVKSHTPIYTGMSYTCLYASDDSTATGTYTDSTGGTTTVTLENSYTYDGKTVYYATPSPANGYGEYVISSDIGWCNDGESLEIPFDLSRAAWYLVYGEPDTTPYEKIVARFEINIADAGGGSWSDPGSTGEVSKTLNVAVTGALSGRHNDPLSDTSYAYTPADQDAATVYGSGGDGGHGGGGGAGASTVIIHTIATERAGSVDETAIAKRHGYGSGGGKGGKGADGCILVYY